MAAERRFDPAELAWLAPAPPALPEGGGWRCRDCGRSSHAASVADPTRCYACMRVHYAWRPAAGPIRRFRRVPPREAARWT